LEGSLDGVECLNGEKNKVETPFKPFGNPIHVVTSWDS